MLSIPDTKIKPPAMIVLEAHMLLDNMYSMQTKLTYQIKWLQLAAMSLINGKICKNYGIFLQLHKKLDLQYIALVKILEH
jgi:hypothetical protein